MKTSGKSDRNRVMMIKTAGNLTETAVIKTAGNLTKKNATTKGQKTSVT